MFGNKRYCFFIPTDSYVEGMGYVPSIAFENEPGHHPMTGRTGTEAPWYWGPDYPTAVATADAMNAKRGIDELEALKILSSSMAASRI